MTTVSRTSGGTLGAPLTHDATDQAERDRVNAYLDGASFKTGVPRDAIVAAIARRADAATLELSRDLILETAAGLATPESLARAVVQEPAQYHNGMRGRADALTDDDAFRASLKTRPLADATNGTVDGTTDDTAFSTLLKRRAGGAQ